MYQSDTINELAAALAKAQAEMESASKSSTNPFFKNKYADISSIIGASRDAMAKNGLSIVQLVIPHATETNANGMALMTQLMHSSGQWIKSIMPLMFGKTDPQSVGSLITYYRRYSYSAMIGIVTESDDDGEKAMARDTAEILISKEEAMALRDLIPQDRAEGFIKYLNSIGYENVDKIKRKDYDTILAMARKAVKA